VLSAKILPLILVLVLAVFPPATVQAATNPVNLELGGEGATPWVISHIKPGDSGTKAVELRNTGGQDGFVTIWVSDIISTEGLNPESEMGDTAEPGEAADYMQLNLTATGLTTDISLPAIISDLPQSAVASNGIEIIPLKAGGTVNLTWEWELPAQTGNDAQGDSISFTINYLLRECAITDVSGVVNADGVFTQGVTANSESGKGKLTVSQGTTGKTKENQPLSEIWIIEMDNEPPPPPLNKTIVGLYYEAGPEGTTFDRPVTITLAYDQSDIPAGVSEGELVIAMWDESALQWVELGSYTIDIVNNTISSPITQLGRYTIFAPPPTPPPLPPEPVEEKKGTPSPTEEVIPPKSLEVDMLGKTGKVEIGTDGTVGEPLILIDRAGNFTLDIESGTKISGSGGIELIRIELRITDIQIVVPDNMVILSPVYELRGYARNMEIADINFNPAATLTIRYDTEKLPENTLPPFIANYAEEQGLVQLQPPSDATIEVGVAKALISHASLFVVLAEVLPPPPPLPARFEVSNLIINPQEAQLGETVTITFTVTNEGAAAGSAELYLIVDSIVRMVKEVTLAGQSSETLTFEVSNLAAGRHKVEIAGLSEQFSVVRVITPPEEAGVNWPVIDLGVGAVIVAGVLGLYFITRRPHQM